MPSKQRLSAFRVDKSSAEVSTFSYSTPMLSLVTQKVLSQPSSANKKKQYEMHNVLGTGTFGKVVVRALRASYIHSTYSLASLTPHRSARHGTSQQSNLVSQSAVPPVQMEVISPRHPTSNLPQRGPHRRRPVAPESRRRESPTRSH